MKLNFALLTFMLLAFSMLSAQDVHIRHNLAGYLPEDNKEALAFSNKKIKGNFTLTDVMTGREVFKAKPVLSELPGYGAFKYYYYLDFTALKAEGEYQLNLPTHEVSSPSFKIKTGAFGDYHEDLLGFMRQQRCGYNPFLDVACHRQDGRAMDGPMPDSTYVDVSGGWHDAGDQLKYLITGSNATARMIMAYQFYPEKFADNHNALGQPGGNGVPDVLDEARWGLDWIHKLHPGKGLLFHQVADDRDHVGFKWPQDDPSDFGWGPNSYRAAYFATGKPQGLGKYMSKATGISNLAGRSAAALALGYQVWKDQLHDEGYALQCLEAAEDLYRMAKENEGYQQGNSFSAPYRYNEDTWTDDMEWAAAELYRSTGKEEYLTDAKKYAEKTATLSWIENDTSAHYQYYPFVNAGHYALYDQVDDDFKKKLAGYYRDGIEQTIRQRAGKTAYSHGAPFIWCSNNLTTALITQILFYEKMTGDMQYHAYMLKMRDWLLGRNPWGTSMFTTLPDDREYPVDVHTSVYVKTKKEVPGGLIDGPIYFEIYKKLIGLELLNPDEFAHLQNQYVTYHDDIGDFSTNEPTMDGTAGAILMMAAFGADR
ncbi:MAG: glycoside hydrolase family 9 protein [Cyclobacteriaceae bacterium]|nr:glycoside hydrolase family 9 protein [Cyclobacteriaceae bacterium]